jgi:diguanylate cyclase (GGDEF)-like protein
MDRGSFWQKNTEVNGTMDEDGNIRLPRRIRNKIWTAFIAGIGVLGKDLSIVPEKTTQPYCETEGNTPHTAAETKLRQQNEYLALLHKTALDLMNQLNLDAVLNQVVTSAANLAGTPHGFIFLLDPSTGMFVRTHGKGIYAQDIGSQRNPGEGLIGEMIRTGGPVMVDDYSVWPQRIAARFGDIRALMEVPLKSRLQIVGAIGLAHQDAGKSFGEPEIQLLSRFAELASIALANAELHTALQTELAERRRAETALIRSEANNKALLTAIPDTIFLFDKQGILLDIRPGKEKVSWLLPGEAVGKYLGAVMSPQMAQNILRHAHLARQANSILSFEYSIADKTEWEVRIGTSGEDEFLAVVRNVTERKEMQSRLEYLSLHDSLTGLYNRNRFELEMRRLDSLDSHCAGVIICDVDGLKFINDSLGHESGDALLTTTGSLLNKVFGKDGIVARVGGDEFAILLPNTSKDGMADVCRRITAACNHHNRENLGLPLSISIGSAVSSEEFPGMRSLYREADNRMYREKLRRKSGIRSSIVQGLMKVSGTGEDISQDQGERRQILAVRLAAQLGLQEGAIDNLRLLAQYHDIGKVGIPERILSKSGPLTEKEKQEIQRHSEIGFRLARSIPELVPIADWILKHHEWWNGAGYPLGLRGSDIPLESRIIAIVDAFAAMTSNRPYRKAMSREQALAELERCSGEQFDPQIVPLFLKIMASEEAG